MDLGNFDRLVLNLTLEERHSLLKKLMDQSVISNEPLYIEETGVITAGNLYDEYTRLPWYLRIWYSILGFFKSKTPIEIYSESQVSVLGRKIEEQTPGIYDFQRRLLLNGFLKQIEKLKEAARFFYSALDTSVNRDNGAFYAFLASLEMPDVHKYLQKETDPAVILEKLPGTPEAELRQIALKQMEAAFAMVSDANRADMYFNARTLFCLKKLSSFLFDRIIMAFSFRPSDIGEICSINVVRELLFSLNDILFSLKIVPPMPLLESLFFFVLQNRAGENGFDLNQEINGLLAKAEKAVLTIREFNKNIPLTWLIRCSSKDMTVVPKEISGGEDWFLIFRDYWKKRVESVCTNYIKERREKELLNSFQQFFKDKSLSNLESIQSESNPDGFPVFKEALTLSFLLSFYLEVFLPDMNNTLRHIVTDGEFNHKENRVDFSLCYNAITKLEEQIKKFDGDISGEGDYGKRYAHARGDMSSIPVKRRKIQIVIDEASEDAGKIIDQAKEASQNMVYILDDLVTKDPAVDEIITMFRRLLILLADITAMDENH